VAAGVGGGAGEGLSVSGELELAGARRPIAFELTADGDGRLAGAATVKQSAWGIKPYSALFGTLKVVDEVIVELTARLRSG
jgi:polyisoprenoid-binding protein YceI